MCFRYSVSKPLEEIQKIYPVKPDLNYSIFDEVARILPRYDVNAFSHPHMPVITNEEPSKLQFYQWGLIPSWIKSVKDAGQIQKRTLNARSETVWDKPAFRASVKKKRCLVVADGFYEWMHFRKEKYPHFIYHKDRPLFAFAGIWEEWVDRETGEIHPTYSILTTEANKLMARIHNSKKRMPVILPRELEGEWLKDDMENNELQDICNSLDEDELSAHTISKLITSRKENPNVPEVQEKFEYPELALI